MKTKTRATWLLLTVGTITLGLAGVAPRAARAESAVDLIEHLFGASNVNAVSGNGGLTIGVSPVGDLAVLTWPSPSYTDQLMHVASNAPDVRAQRSMLGDPRMGAAIGLAWELADGTRAFSWLRDAPWVATQSWAERDAPVAETRFEHAALGLTVRVTDLVFDGRDVWARRVHLARTPASPVTSARVLFYANPAPTLSRVPQLPFADWALDGFNDFAALFDPAHQAVLHFRPAGRGDVTELLQVVAPPAIDYGPLGLALAAGPLDAAQATARAAALDADYGPGVYLALGADRPLAGHHVGFDPTPICPVVGALVDNVQALPERFPGLTLPLDPAIANVLRCSRDLADLVAENGWSAAHAAAPDAFADAADGTLSGAHAAAGRANEALAVDAPFDAAGTFSATFFTAVAATATDATTLLDAARADGYDALYAATLAAWSAWISRARLPAAPDPRVVEVARRALLNLKVGLDRETGAIVASIARQAPYGLDWPRDGAFFDAALDVAGYPELVEAHGRFYLATVRRAPAPTDPLLNPEAPADPDDPTADTFPAWAWEMNTYADGMPGGNIRFEIDNAGLTVWGLLDHARYLADPAARRAWLDEVWPVVSPACALLARWRDPATGLQAPANEDDNLAFTQSLHGAVTTWLALDRAAPVAAELGHADEAARLRARADELHAAILTHLYDPAAGLFRETLDVAQNPGNAPGGASSWLAWPAAFLPHGDARLEAQLVHNLALAESRLDPANGGGAYVTKILMAAALGLDDPAARERVARALERMVHLAATADTGVFGETFVAVDRDGDGVDEGFSARVSNPHLWAGTLVYLTAMALYHPERFTDPLAPPTPPAAEGGGGCGAAPSPAGWVLALGLSALAAAARRRRRRAPRA